MGRIDLLFVSTLFVTLNLATSSPCGLCHTDWRKVYINSGDGSALFGDIEDLKGAVRSGSHIRVFVAAWGTGGYAAETDSAEIVGGGICVQSLFHISRTSPTVFQTNAYWWFLKLCTTGNAHMARYSVGSAVNIGESRVRVQIVWFIKDVVCRCIGHGPIFSNSNEGTPISGDKDALIEAITNGQDIRASSNNYTYPFQNVVANGALISGQSLWHVSQTNVGNYAEFQPNAYWWFTIVSSSGRRDMSRWTIGAHTDRGHTDDRVATEWFADPCWKKIYSHDANGAASLGSRAALVSAVEAGNRVRLVRGNYVVEADNLQVVDGHVSAQVLGHVSKAGTDSFQDNAYWYFQTVDTSGHVHTSRYNVGENVSRGTSETLEAVEWVVETRAWTKILETNKLGHVLNGSKAAVRDAIQNGASFRIILQFCSGSTYVASANNLQLEANGEASAMALKSVSMTRLDEPGARFKIQDNAYWWFLLINTRSEVSMSRWTLGEHQDRGLTNERARVQWFVNY